MGILDHFADEMNQTASVAPFTAGGTDPATGLDKADSWGTAVNVVGYLKTQSNYRAPRDAIISGRIIPDLVAVFYCEPTSGIKNDDKVTIGSNVYRVAEVPEDVGQQGEVLKVPLKLWE